MKRVLCAILIGACGDDASDMPVDAAVPDADAPIQSAPFALAPIAPPEPPREAALGDPIGELPICDGDQAAYPFSGGCVSVSRPCPSDGFPPAPVGGPALYVRPGATGDGTRSAPLGSIAAALARASAGTTVLLAPGRYAEIVVPPAGVAIEGACASGTILAPTLDSRDLPGTFHVERGVVALRHVTIDAPRIGISALGGDLTLEGVVIASARRFGIVVGHAMLHASAIAIRNVVDLDARAFQVEGGSAELERADLGGARDLGVALYGEARATLSDVRVRGVPGSSSPEAGGGIQLTGSSTATLERIAIENVQSAAVTVLETGSLTLRDSVVREVVDAPGVVTEARGIQFTDGTRGTIERCRIVGTPGPGLLVRGEVAARDIVLEGTRGISVAETGVLTLERASLTSSHYVAVRLISGGHATITDLDIAGVEADPAGEFGYGVEAQGSTLAVTRARVVGAHGVALAMLDDSTGTGADLDLRDSEPNPMTGRFGLGIVVTRGGGFVGERVTVERCADAGIAVGDGSSIELSDLVVEHTRQNRNVDGNGYGLVSLGDATITRARFEANHGAGVFASGGTVTIEDAEILRNEAIENVTLGRGIGAQGGGRVEARHVFVHHHEGAGLIASEPGSIIVGDDIAIADITTSSSDCETEACAAYGVAAGAFESGTIQLSRFTIERSGLCGVYAERPGAVTLREGRVTGSAVAVCLEGGTDLTGLQDRVVYEGNAQALAARSVPVPTAMWSGDDQL